MDEVKTLTVGMIQEGRIATLEKEVKELSEKLSQVDESTRSAWRYLNEFKGDIDRKMDNFENELRSVKDKLVLTNAKIDNQSKRMVKIFRLLLVIGVISCACFYVILTNNADSAKNIADLARLVSTAVA